MSNTNTTLATLAGGFVPMLLKNVLSSKGAKLSLKTVSFKGQIDEIIGEYKQFWPLTDLQVQRYVPGENDDEEDENKAESSEHHDDEKLGKSAETKRKMSVAVKSEPKVKPKDGPAEDNKKPTRSINFSEDNDDTPRNDDKKNGLFRTLSALTNKSQDEDEHVDLFIDLSVADTAGWSIYGSSESLPSESIMPRYFDPNKINEEYEDVPTTQQSVLGTPPDYARAISVSYHPKSSV